MIDLHDLLVAALAGRYEIERELGHGGMAVVYLARDAKHGRRVAIKVLRPELATSLGAERFLREINIAARLTHPNILALHDSGDAQGMLYFVMPYVEGETLRDRLEREHQLPVDESVAIAKQVGLALDYAHEHGVVHRDIKPENILLVGDHVLVADFGLARALYTAGTERLTESAVAVGTPAYMSPEQAAADPDVDGRTDLYSLACVLFEMIAGLPPFKGATSAALLAQHLTAKPPSICAQRPHCPEAVDAAVARALEKTPADRFRTAKEFVVAMTAPAVTSSGGTNVAATVPHRRRLAKILAGSVAVAVVLIGAAFAMSKGHSANAEALNGSAEANSYVVLPLSPADSAARRDTALVAQRVSDALGEWDGVRVIDERQVRDQLAALSGSGHLRLDDALDVAARLGAARLVWGETYAGEKDRRARLTLYDVATRRELKPVMLSYGADGPDDGTARLTANALLRTRAESPWSGSRAGGHPSLAAWLAYDAGRDAIARWDVGEAYRQFRAAVTIDPGHPQANLWLTLAEMWSGMTAERWRSEAKRAYELRGRLDPRDTVLASAQLAMSEGRNPDACAAYRSYAAADTTGVIGLYGIGECQSRDSIVIRDDASPSGWRFRGSMNQAISAYMKIVDDRAPPQPTFVYTRLSQLLSTAGNQLRLGHSADRPRMEFGAFAALDGDTLVFVPTPMLDSGMVRSTPTAVASARAVEHNRALLRRLYTTWAAHAPPTVQAHTALAAFLERLEELGDDDANPLSALGQARRARRLASDPDERLMLARMELRLLVKTGAWPQAARFADSLFVANGQSTTDSTLAGPAALTGRVRTLGAILRAWGGAPTFSLKMPNGTPLDAPAPLVQDAATTFAFALSGACVDSLRQYRGRVERRLASYIPDARRREIVRGVLLRRPLSVGAPCVGAAALTGIAPAGDRMVELEQALARGDTAEVRAIYRRLTAARARLRPGDSSMDYTYIESWILATTGDTAEAINHLDRSLEALPTLGVYFLDFPAHSAGLVRAMGLRAELAAATRDRVTAAKWGTAVATLWAHADPELQPYVQKMRGLAGLTAVPAGHGGSGR